MSTKIGHFEILSELAKSPTCAVYKANDTESGQTIALKAIQLSAFGEGATALEQALLAEAERTKVLSSSNVTPVYGAGEIEGQFCAAMEYIQGNSIATMLARKEGFSIWDLLDIGRQLCSGLDHAASHQVVHYSLEPAKIMCGWDGTVKILGFGVSSVGNFIQHVAEGVPSILHYMSPEQVRGEATDGRSNLFSLGAMFYEMVTERKAFDREDAASLRTCILESTPVPPIHINGKVHPLLSDLIMKALSKDPAQRYQNGRALLDDLEKCKESKTLAAKKPEAPKSTVAPKAAAAAQSKFVSSAAAKPAPKPAPKPTPPPSAPRASSVAKPAAPAAQSGLARPSSLASPASRPAGLAKPAEKKLAEPVSKAAAAAAGAGSDATSSSAEIPEIDLSDQFSAPTIEVSSQATIEAAEPESAYMSAEVADEPQVETFEPEAADDGPKIAVDPMMAEGGPKGGPGGVSFSEMTELPPLKEIYVAPPAPKVEEPLVQASAPLPPTVFRGGSRVDEKPKVQPREVAEKAIKEIKGVPPKLFGYALGGALALIVAIGIGVTVYIHTLNSDDDPTANRPAAVADTPAQPEASQPAPKTEPAPAPVAQPPAETAAEPAAPVAEPAPRERNTRRKPAAPPVVIPGQLAVDSTPQGAQVQIDGKSSPNWVTPFAVTNLQPGQHSIAVSRAGYSTDTRTVAITSGNRATTVVHLSQLSSTLVVKSEPAGASIYVDGRDVGAKTPAQVSVDKGQHVVLVRMMGYIDETMNGQFTLGQTFNFSPTLRPMGNVDNIKTVGKMSKLFGGKGVGAGQGVLSIHTTPKGAQVAINSHIMDKNSPLDVALDPGNYVVDITMTGYAPVHKVVTADRGGKVVLDEVLQPQ